MRLVGLADHIHNLGDIAVVPDHAQHHLVRGMEHAGAQIVPPREGLILHVPRAFIEMNREHGMPDHMALEVPLGGPQHSLIQLMVPRTIIFGGNRALSGLFPRNTTILP